ncbi:MAG: acetylornithine/succinylornithine family transaminase [Chloroflexi bacterium]|nr:acetylornithine/succinylornithine family transaminase [Chloroflexota bacterium]
MDFQELEQQHTPGIYPKRDLTIVRGKDATVWDDQGHSYIDCTSNQGVNTLGYSNEAVAKAVAEQAATLINCSEIFYNDKRAQFMDLLYSILPQTMQRIFLCSSGTEAIEASLKFARLSTGRTDVVATVRAFHGRTMGALSATYDPKYREPFKPLVPGFSHVPYNNLEAMKEAVTEETAAILVEPVQGEGGVHPGTPEYLQGLRELANERGALLIFDEVQTGFGRTGKWFALEHSGVTPDLLAMGKAIGGGVPTGAVGIGASIKNLAPGVHGTTFGGNPLSCAAGIASLSEMKRLNIPQMAAEKGAYLKERLEEINAPTIREVRGLGLMLGVELKTKSAPYLRALQAEGVLAIPAGMNVLRLLPPAIITREQIDTVIEKVTKVLQAG